MVEKPGRVLAGKTGVADALGGESVDDLDARPVIAKTALFGQLSDLFGR